MQACRRAIKFGDPLSEARLAEVSGSKIPGVSELVQVLCFRIRELCCVKYGHEHPPMNEPLLINMGVSLVLMGIVRFWRGTPPY